MTRRFRFFLATAILLTLASTARAASLSGLWDATVVVNGNEIPFRMELAVNGSTATGSFFNGDDKVISSRGHLDGQTLTLEFDDYATRLEATLKSDALEGRYDRGPRGFYPFKARRFVAAATDGAAAPSIAGVWNVQVRSAKGESAWRLIVRQSGPEVAAAVLRVDGDTGALTGAYRDGVFTLSHFSGARPSLFIVTPQKDGTLAIVQKGASVPNGKPGEVFDMKMTAVRADDERAAALAQPSDPSRFTSVKDPTEPLRFSFPDLDGHIVANTDPRFAGRVLLVSISGSWCPNCHDEAPFLVDLYKRYHERGLEIVTLSFEEPEQQKDLTRLRAFIKHYGITYTVLVPGKPEELADKLPQAVNLNSFPTTFFIGRDGTVRGAHAGFPGKVSGAFHEAAKKEITERVEQLLGERGPTDK